MESREKEIRGVRVKDRIYFVDCVELEEVFRDNLDYSLIMNESKNKNKISINDKHE